MKRSLPTRVLLMALMAGTLLFAQISGLHRHLHAEAGAASHPLMNELHFGDAGLHNDAHHQPLDAAAGGHQAHADVEFSAISDALAKVSASLLPIGLLMCVALLLLVRFPRSLPREREANPPPKQHPFSLHPPAHGPPRRFSTAV